MINSENLKAVFFDADDTLYRVRGSVGERYHPHFVDFGIDATVNDIDNVIPEAWRALSKSYENREDKYRTSHERDQEIWREYVSYVLKYFTDRPLTEEIFLAIYNEFGKGESRELMPHVTDLITDLRKRGYITGVLTNNDKRIHSLIPDLGLSEHFDHVLCASDIGFKKPARELFRGLEEIVNASPEELLYIGDCPKNDMTGGQEAGWQVLLYAPEIESPFKETARDEPFPTIQCFREVDLLLK